jgi:hypothetical protein
VEQRSANFPLLRGRFYNLQHQNHKVHSEIVKHVLLLVEKITCNNTFSKYTRKVMLWTQHKDLGQKSIYEGRIFVCFVCQVEIFQITMPFAALLMSLESSQ